jgi:hypothetical protein
MATTIRETENFSILSMRVGMLMRDKRGKRVKEVYIQPGDATAAMWANLDALDELPDDAAAKCFDIVMSENMDGVE